MSDDNAGLGRVPPLLATAAKLRKSGFVPLDKMGLMVHHDGRLAAVKQDGSHQIHESIGDAMRWLGVTADESDDNPSSDLPLGSPTP